MGKQLFPGKGSHLVMNEEILTFVAGVTAKINEYYTDGLHDEDPEKLLDMLSDDPDFTWTSAKDSFGNKLYASMPYKEGELRVTVVLTKGNELKLDVREWYAGN